MLSPEQRRIPQIHGRLDAEPIPQPVFCAPIPAIPTVDPAAFETDAFASMPFDLRISQLLRRADGLNLNVRQPLPPPPQADIAVQLTN